MDADHVVAQITSLMPLLYHTLALGMPSPNQTCALTSTKADLVHASPALTGTGVTSQDVQQPSPGTPVPDWNPTICLQSYCPGLPLSTMYHLPNQGCQIPPLAYPTKLRVLQGH